MKFYVLQVSLIPLDQALFYKEGNERDLTLIDRELLAERSAEFGYRLKVEFHDSKNGIILGKITRRNHQTLHDRNLEPYIADDYPPILWLWDRSEQAIVVQKNSRVFPEGTTAANAFSELISPGLLDAGLSCFIKPKTSEAHFWESYESFSKVTEVQISLIAPNMFGQTKKAVGDALKALSTDTNAAEIGMDLKNEDKGLQLHGSKNITAAIDWAKDGGGDWKIKGFKLKSNRKSSIKSQSNARVFEIDGLRSPYLPPSSELASIVIRLRAQYSFKNEK